MFKSIKSDRLFSKGQRLAKREQFAEAIILFEQAALLNPKYTGIYLHLGLAQSSDGQYDQAIQSIRRAMELKPSNPVYPAFLGLVHLDQQIYDAADAAFDQALAIDPAYSLPPFLKALALLIQENVEDAYPELAKNANNLGSSYQARLLSQTESYILRRREAATSLGLETAFIDKSERSHPRNPFHRNLIKTSYRIAILLNRLNIDRAASEVRQHFLKGNCHNRLDEFDAAIGEYQNALELDAGFFPAHERLIEVFFEKRDFAKALESAQLLEEEEQRKFKRSNSVNEENIRSSYPLVLGALRYYLCQYDQAEIDLILSIKNDPYNYLPYYFLGVCSLIRNDQKSALRHFKKSVSLLNPRLVLTRLEMAKKLSQALKDRDD